MPTHLLDRRLLEDLVKGGHPGGVLPQVSAAMFASESQDRLINVSQKVALLRLHSEQQLKQPQQTYTLGCDLVL